MRRLKAGRMTHPPTIGTFAFPITLILVSLSPAETLLCVQCPGQGAASLTQCDRIVTCEPGESCYKEITDDGRQKIYKAGCRKENTCSAPAPVVLGGRDVSTPCRSCCNQTDMCNYRLCQQDTDFLPFRDKVCLQCKGVSHPSQCDRLTQCPVNENCATMVYLDGAMITYQMGCVRSVTCGSPPGQRDRQAHIQLCGQCCLQDFCNRHLCIPSTTSPPSSPTPTTLTPTVPATTSVTRTSTLATTPVLTVASTSPSTDVTTTEAGTHSTPAHVGTSTLQRLTSVETSTTFPVSAVWMTPHPRVLCESCSSYQDCQTRSTVQYCPAAAPYCMTSLRVMADDTMDLVKGCASDDVCQTRWLGETSHLSQCTHFRPDVMPGPGMQCSFCCSLENCNLFVLVPEKSTWYASP